jgi:regulator of replication initiation timing
LFNCAAITAGHCLQEETADLLKGMSAQVAELLAANKELRAENERLRRIY